MLREFVNCPTDKDINSHFYDQLFQLSLQPKSQEDALELMHILNSYLNYPDQGLANNHRNANKLGLLDLTAEERVKLAESQNLDDDFRQHIRQTRFLKVYSSPCRCCGFIVQENNIAVCNSQLKNVFNLGTATRIFFRTFLNIGILLVIMAVIYSAFAFGTNISTAYSSNYLNSSNSTLDYLSISLGSKSKHKDLSKSYGEEAYYISCCLGLLMLFIWLFLFIYFKSKVGLIENDLKRVLGVSDFSIAIENMPIDFTREEIEKQFNTYLRMLKIENRNIELDEIKVVKYNEGKPFYLNQSEFADKQLIQIHRLYREIKEKIVGYVEEYREKGKFITPPSQRRYNYSKIQELSYKRTNKYEEIVKKIKIKLNSKHEVSKTVVFVTFLTYQMRQFILSQNRNSIFHSLKRLILCWKQNTYFSVTKGDQVYQDIKIEQPPQPEDINWGNLGLSSCQKFWRKAITFFLTIVMIGICFVIVYALSTLQRDQKNRRYISILISLAISITNLCIIKVIQYMTIVEKEYSMNKFQISIAIKSVTAQLINSIIVPVLVNYYIKDKDIFGTSGLVQDIFILGISSSLVPPLLRLFDPYNIFLYLRYKYYRGQVRKLRLSQYELNQMSQKMQFQIGMEYIYIISNFLFICFFVSLQPIMPLFAILGLFLMYWIQKYSLFNRCQRPVAGPDIITSMMYQLIHFGPISFALGNLTWSCFLPDESFRSSIVINIISAGFSLVMFLFPYDLCLKKAQIKQQTNYYTKRIYFPSEYDRLNPSTSRFAIEQYRNFLYEKKKELQTAGDTVFSQEMFQQLANISQKNIYKGNIMNRFTQKEQDFIIQKIFNNQSRNAVNPMLLLSALAPRVSNRDVDFREGNANSERIFRSRPSASTSIKLLQQEPTYRNLINVSEMNVRPNQQEDYLNIYHSNIKIDDILELDSNIKFPSRESNLSHGTWKRHF